MSDDSAQFTVRYWGVRGSVPTPGPETVRYGGNTTCLEIRCDDKLFVIDSGTGARGLGSALMKASQGGLKLHLLYSHQHLDHIQGFPFFAPIYAPTTQLDVHAGTSPETTLRVLETQMAYPNFPVLLSELPSDIRYHGFEPGDSLELDGITIDTCALNHPGGAVAYRFNHRGHAFVQASDTEHDGDTPDPGLVALCRDADFLSYDSTYVHGEEYERFRGWGHSTWLDGQKVADAANVKRFVVFHHDPAHDDDFMDQVGAESLAARPGTLVAREGLTIDLLSGQITEP